MKDTFNLADINSVRPIIRTVLRYKRSGSALDLGCGIGRHSLFLAKKGFRVTAVDMRVEALAALKELARLQKLPITVQREDVTMYAPKKKFDLILSNMVLHFLPSHVQKEMILKMQKYTKKNGINVVSSYTDKNKKGTRPYLTHAGALRKIYQNAGWSILYYEEGVGKSAADNIWKEEIIAQKP